MDDFGGIDTIDIICTTPEKFDAMTRRHRSRGSLRFFNEVSSTADIMKMNTSVIFAQFALQDTNDAYESECV